LDEAAEKFQKVLNSDDAITQYSAAHGLASCMLVFARQAAEEGKFGDALSCLKKGINSLSTFTENKVVFCCVWKLLGDLHSHGSIIPASVFEDKNTDVDNENKHKMNFIAQGEDAYMHIISSIENIQDSERANEMTSLRTIALNDLAINLFLRARLRSEYLHEGSGIGPSTSRIDVSNDEECQKLLDLSMKYFISAIELDPLLPMSWCGLGTALVSKDPILAQHAFCRALQLDKSTEDAWANLSLLFFDHNNIVPSEEAVDSLTQVADSAIMWIVRGLLLEKQFKVNQDTESVFSKASDAYRASLQISRHQAAYLGLSLTSRRLDVIGNIVSGDYVMEANKIATKESHANLQMFLNSSSGCNLGALTLDGIMTCEKSLTLQGHDNFLSEQAKTFLQTGKDILVESQMKIAELPGTRALGSKDSAAVQMSNAGLVMKASSFVLKEDVDQIVSSFLDVADNALKSVCSDCSVLRGSESISISMARQNVIQNPDCGLMWLDLSKALLRALTSGVTDESSAIVKTTMQKTKQIMVACATDAPLLHPTSKGSSTVLKSIPSTPVESTKLSEAFALSDWIEDIASESHNNCAYDLQRAVLLDPENFFARSKIDE
jgi:tetratricopeptide (TPR) repeat protein